MKKTAEILLDMLYPKKCPLCHQILKEKNSLVCPDCFQKAIPMKEPLCMKCGRPVRMEEEYCQDCRSGVHHFTEGRSIFPYGEIWRQSLVRFNQAAYLAERVSRFTGIPWSDNLVIKIRNTKSQKKLNASQRKKNLRNAYLVTRKITGFSVLVVDDVYTTGSTMDAMAMCLQEAGAKDVYFLTVCAGRA